MINWLKNWVGRFVGIVSDPVLALVHWAVHALALVVEAVFHDVALAWRDYWAAVTEIERATWDFGAAVFGLAVKVLRYWVPRIWGEIKRTAQALWHGIDWVWSHAVAEINALRRLAWKWINDLWHLVLRDVWKPLRDFTLFLLKLIREWAYVAWWWITHLDKLADAMIFHIARSLEKYAWQLGRLLGTFLTALIIHNVRRFVQLLETIIAAVL